MKIIRKENWQPCDGVILEDEADKAVRCSDNHVLVIAGPGAGKTELLAQKASFLFQTNQCMNPKKILAISFKTDAAQNLKERVERRCGTEVKGRFASMTYDAFAKSILDHFMYALPDELRPVPDYLIDNPDTVDAAFRYVGYINSDRLSSSKLKNFYDLELARVDLPISGSEFAHLAWPFLLHGFNGLKASLTFKMIMKLAIYIVKTNPLIKRALQATYSYVFLDEFQDTTGIQYELIKECFWNSDVKITAVGDNKQRIMLWAGALNQIFNNFYDELSPLGVRLSMNHRSAPRLVALQNSMHASLRDKSTSIAVDKKWDEGDGDISLVIADDEQLESTVVVNDIISRISKGTRPNDICILCKQKPQDYVPVIISGLEKNGIRARIEIDYQNLIKEPIIDLLIKFMTCACERRHPCEWRFIEETLVELWGISNSNDIKLYDAMQYKLVALLDSIKERIKSKNIDRTQWHDILHSILSLFNIDKIKSKNPTYKQGLYLYQIIDKFEALFYSEYTVAHGDWKQAIENFCGEHSIPIMTIHKSKGLEYSAVYFIGLEDSAFWNFKKQPSEDRCAFFVALSRARKSITFTFCKHRNNLKYSSQQHNTINEFYDLLQRPGVAKITNATQK